MQGEEGIIPALRLVEVADIGNELAAQLKSLIERRRIRFLVQASADGAEVDTSNLSYEAVLASLEDLTDELDDEGTKELANKVAAMGGSLKGVRALKIGAGMAKINEQVVEAPEVGDLGFSLVRNPAGNLIRPAWLTKGEFVFSVPAVKGLGIKEGATLDKAHAAGLDYLRSLHTEARGLAERKPEEEVLEEAAPEAIAEAVKPAEATSEQEKTSDQTPEEIIGHADAAIERQERAATMDDKGRLHASQELIESLIEAESGGDPNAVSTAGAVGLLQILPSTARDPGFGIAGLEGSDEEVVAQLKNPEINRRLGSEYLSACKAPVLCTTT